MGDWPVTPGAFDEGDEEALGVGGGREEEEVVVEGGAARDGAVGVLEDEDRDCAAGDAEVARLPGPGNTVRVVMVSAGGHGGRWREVNSLG